jgi:hypothetical protein
MGFVDRITWVFVILFSDFLSGLIRLFFTEHLSIRCLLYLPHYLSHTLIVTVWNIWQSSAQVCHWCCKKPQEIIIRKKRIRTRKFSNHRRRFAIHSLGVLKMRRHCQTRADRQTHLLAGLWSFRESFFQSSILRCWNFQVLASEAPLALAPAAEAPATEAPAAASSAPTLADSESPEPSREVTKMNWAPSIIEDTCAYRDRITRYIIILF